MLQRFSHVPRVPSARVNYSLKNSRKQLEAQLLPQLVRGGANTFLYMLLGSDDLPKPARNLLHGGAFIGIKCNAATKEPFERRADTVALAFELDPALPAPNASHQLHVHAPSSLTLELFQPLGVRIGAHGDLEHDDSERVRVHVLAIAPAPEDLGSGPQRRANARHSGIAVLASA